MTTEPHDPDFGPVPQEEFWNDDADWTPSAPTRTRSREGAGLGSTVTAWWDSLMGGGTRAGRVHGSASGRPHHTNGADRDVTGGWFIEPRGRSERTSGVDPRVARIGVLAVAVTLVVPLVMGFTSSSDDDSLRSTTPVEVTPVTLAPVVDGPDTAADTGTTAGTGTGTDTTADTDTDTAADSTQSDVTFGTRSSDSDDADTSTRAAAASLQQNAPSADTTRETSTTAAPTTTAARCTNTYEVAAGDYWIRLADASGAPLSDLLAVNGATTETALMPGRSICLPAGASTPAPPAPPTTSAPRATSPSPTTTNAPTTTAPRRPSPTTTTTTSPPRTDISASDAEAIIRSVWPDHLEDRAVLIAWRESNHQPDVRNYCCFGLFQIYYNVHRSWLDDFGVYSATDLYDPWKNARAAYALYQNQGWGPWSQTNY